jgi:hypothetical protein
MAVGAVMLAALYASATPPPEERNMPPSIQEVKAKHADDLMRRRGVLSVGIGRGAEGEPVIVIGVDRQHAELATSLPATLEGYAVRVELMGTIKAQ